MKRGKGKDRDDEALIKEVKARYVEFEERKALIKRIRERFHAYGKKYNSVIEEGRALSESLQEYGFALLGANKESVLGNCLVEVSDAQKCVEDALADVCVFSLKHLDAPFEDFIAHEVENAQAIKKRYDKSRGSLDNTLSKSTDGNEEGESRLVEITNELMDQLANVDRALDLHMLGFLSRYINSVNTLHAHLSQRVAGSVASIEKHSNTHFSELVEDFEVETGNPFSTFSVDFNPAWSASQVDAKKNNLSNLPLQELRKKKIAELLKRERVYVDTLKSVVKLYLFEFRNHRQVTKVVSLQDLEDLFCNIEEITDLHQDFTWELQTALEQNLDQSVASFLVEFLPKLEQPYYKYIANLSKSADTLARLTKDKRYVASAIKQCQEKDKSGRTLPELLILPSYHIKTYRPFVQSGLDSTPTTSPDFDVYDDALALVVDLDDRVAAAVNASAQYQILVGALRRIDHGDQFASSTIPRRFVRDTQGQTLDGAIHVFLFSDLLVTCVQDPASELLTIKRKISLGSVSNVAVIGSNTLQVEVMQEQPLGVLLPSASEAQRWVIDIRETMQSLYKTKTFGVPLSELMTKNEREKNSDIPVFVNDALDTIDSTGLEVEGIFRVSGSVVAIRSVKEMINQGLPVDYSSMDIHSVAGLVQTWLRELPDPLLTCDLYREWLSHVPNFDTDKIRETVAKLPQHNRFLLQYLCQFLNRVASFGMVNKMKSGNLSIVFGPSLLSERNGTTNMDSLQDVCQLVQYLIDNQKPIFEGVEEERDTFRQKLLQEKAAQEQHKEQARSAGRKEAKEKRITEEREKAAREVASNPELVKQADEKRKERREARDKAMQEEKEAMEREKKRLADEERAQLDAVTRARIEAEEQRLQEKKKKELEDIEARFREQQLQIQKDEEEARERKRQREEEREKRRLEEEEQQRQVREREEARLREEQRLREEALLAEQARLREEERLRLEQEEAALPSCALCAKKVRDGVVSKERGITWHKECFVCIQCRNPITGAYATGAGNVLTCGPCVAKKSAGIAPEGCPRCGLALSGKVVRILDKRIHKACFKCELCLGSLDDGYYEVNGKVVCENCAKAK